MTQRPLAPQQGAILFLLLLALIGAATIAFDLVGLLAKSRTQQATRTTLTLKQAKDALIARAVSDGNRPGSLPCPDLHTNSQGLANYPGDGKADNLVGSDCPSHVGWLPWITLDLPEPLDDSGSRLWYVLAPAYRDDDNAPALNSQTIGGLKLDQRDDIVALVIAPGSALGSQQRRKSNGQPSLSPADYLDAENGNGDDHRYSTGPAGEDFNDRILAITQQELMAATGKRIAGEIRQCLEAHASATSNPDHRYPWPTPLAGNASHGQAGSQFGRIPDTEPGSGPQKNLQELAQQLRWPDGQTHLSTQQLTALQNLRAALGTSRNLLGHLLDTSTQLKTTASVLNTQLVKLGSSLQTAMGDGQITNTEASAISAQGENSQALLNDLVQQLDQTGYDFFPGEINALAALLKEGGDRSRQLEQTRNLLSLLAQANTKNPDINQALAQLSSTATATENSLLDAIAQAANNTTQAIATQQTHTLAEALLLVPPIINAQRVNTSSGTIRGIAKQVEANISSSNRQATLEEARTIVSRLETTSSKVLAEKAASLTALTKALAVTPSPPDIPTVSTLLQLASTIDSNEDNLTRSSIATQLSAYKQIQLEFSSAATPSSGHRLLNATTGLGIWTALINRHSTTMATLTAPSSNTTSGEQNSVQQAINQAIASLDGKNGSLNTLTKYLSAPETAGLKSTVEAALAKSQAEMSNLNIRLQTLQGALSSSQAEAFPVLWHAERCQFIQDKDSWWRRNQWQPEVFYQISSIYKENIGKLSLNNQGGYRLLVVTAGPRLAGQARPSNRIGDYLEAGNADASRNDLALTPTPAFTRLAISAQFNDQFGN